MCHPGFSGMKYGVTTGVLVAQILASTRVVFFSNFCRYPMATGTRQVPVINLGAGCTVPFFLDADAFKGM